MKGMKKLAALALTGLFAVPAAVSAQGLQQYMSQNRSAQTVTYQIKATLDATNHGWNFNGYANGNMRIVVPQGWKVSVQFKNLSPMLPHSAGVIAASPDNLPASGDSATLAFPGAATDQFTAGLGPNSTGQFSFTADQAGEYLLYCGVPGHGRGGMWVHFQVSASADSASISARSSGS